MLSDVSAEPRSPADPRTALVLIVEDDGAERARLVRTLTPIATRIVEASSVAEALHACATEPLDLVLLDLALPDGHGAEVLARLRTVSSVPVIVHSGNSDESEKVQLLDAGADDFVTKPVGDAELAARVRSHLRRSKAAREGSSDFPFVMVDGIEIDLTRQRLLRDGKELRLSPTEWALLRAFAMNAGRTLTHSELWRLVWGREFGDAKAHLRVHITHVRRKIEREPSAPRLIITEPGVGYRFELP